MSTILLIIIVIIIFTLIYYFNPDLFFKIISSLNVNDEKPKINKPKNSFISKGELECKNVVEDIFECKFDKLRPDWLKYITGRNLEIDVANIDLGLGIEYDGEQHFKFVSRFHKTENDYLKQVERDKWKNDKCKKLGFTLIRVPYTIKVENIRSFLIEEIMKTKHKYSLKKFY